MEKFSVGEQVKITDHRRSEYKGLTGTIAEVNHDTLAPTTRPITPTGSLPPLGRKTTYDVTIDIPPYRLSRVEEEWLELLPACDEHQQHNDEDSLE